MPESKVKNYLDKYLVQKKSPQEGNTDILRKTGMRTNMNKISTKRGNIHIIKDSIQYQNQTY